MSSNCLIEAAEDQDRLTIDRHAHSEIAGCPSRLRVQIDHAPHVVIDIVHLNRVSDLFLVELGPSTEHVDILVVEDAACSRVTSYVKVGYTTPSIILDVILLTGRVETLSIIASNDEDEAALRVESCEVRSFEEEWRLVFEFGTVLSFELHHPVAAHIVLMPATYAKDASLVRHNCPTKLRYAELVVEGNFV